MALALRFDRQTYTFEKPKQSTSPVCTKLKSLLDDAVGEGHGYIRQYSYGDLSFNDLGFYMSLCAKEQCTKVEISHIHVFYSDDYCNGIQVHYRITLSDGSKFEYLTPPHVYNNGYYASDYVNPVKSTITLQEGEYLAEIRTRQGEITDQITFITNQRTLSFGGNGGSGEDMSAPPDLSRRIVAFVGTSRGILEKLGAISVSRNWEEVGPLVLLRTLVEKNRASVVLQDNIALGDDVVVQRLITNTDEDLFKRIVSFLGHGMKVSD